MVNLSVRIIDEDKEFKIKIVEKIYAFVIFVPLCKTFLQMISSGDSKPNVIYCK